MVKVQGQIQGQGQGYTTIAYVPEDCYDAVGFLTEMRMRSELVAKPSQRLTMVPDPLVMAAMLWAPGADLLH